MIIVGPSEGKKSVKFRKLTDQQLSSGEEYTRASGLAVTRLRSPLVLGIHAMNRGERAWWVIRVSSAGHKDIWKQGNVYFF